MRLLVIGDTHIDDPYLGELRDIFAEILEIKADAVLHLGDYYNFNKPSPESLAFGTEMAKKLVSRFRDFTLQAGNGRHNWMNGYSVVDYLTYLGVKCVGMEYEQVIDGKKVLFGHHMTNESYKEYGSHFYTVADLKKKYDLVLLGHQHIPQDITPSICHLGSVFYQHFNESKDPFKRVAIIEDGEMEFIPLKTPIPMKDVTELSDLTAIDPRTKVRFLISSFEAFKKSVNGMAEWRNKFVEFKYELRYDKTFAKAKAEQKSNTHDDQKRISIIEEINRQVKDEAVRDLLIAQFKEESNVS